MKAIETSYAGYKFRSRLEARWAVFFDALGLKWEYEPEGFVLPDGACYLPDFWIPALNTYIEVKPAGGPDEGARALCAELSQGGSYVWLVQGDPYDHHAVSFFCGAVDMIGCAICLEDGELLPFMTRSDRARFGLNDKHPNERAAIAARSARFEHGQSGASR